MEIHRTSAETNPATVQYEVAAQLQEEEAQQYWEIVEGGFQELNSRSLLKQDMTRDEFMHDMLNSDVLKFKAFTDEGPIALFTLHANLEDISWVNVSKVSDFAETITSPDGRSYYVGTIVVKPDAQGLGVGVNLMKYLADWYEQDAEETGGKSIGFFDHSDDNKGLPYLIKYATRTDSEDPQTERFRIEPLGSHKWFTEEIDEIHPLSSSDEGLQVVESITDQMRVDTLYATYLKNVPEEDFFYKPLTPEEFGELLKSDAKKFIDGPNLAIVGNQDDISEKYIYEKYPGARAVKIEVLAAEIEQAPEFLLKLADEFGEGEKKVVLIHESPKVRQKLSGHKFISSAAGEEQSMWAIYGDRKPETQIL